ncbi:MAG: rhomboid family intramembrane serine protease [Arachnia sp.]
MKATRQLEGPYGGTRSKDPRITTFVLIGINLAVYVALLLTGGPFGALFNHVALVPQGYCALGQQLILIDPAGCTAGGGQWVNGVATGAVWQILTSGFAHSGLVHIGFNMFALFALGPGLERVFGRARFLAVYFVALLMGSAAVMVLSEPYVAVVGASGAIFGLLGALVLLAIKHRGNVQSILFWLVANVAITIAYSSSISWQGHLGGLIGGVAATAVLIWLPRDKRRWQWPALAALGVVTILICAARAISLAFY